MPRFHCLCSGVWHVEAEKISEGQSVHQNHHQEQIKAEITALGPQRMTRHEVFV